MTRQPDDFLINHYRSLFHYHGPNYRAVQWSSTDAQIGRFSVLSELVHSSYAVMDVGCGLGDLLNYLRYEKEFTGRYLGLDFVPEFIDYARERTVTDRQASFEIFDARYEGFPQGYDAVLISGIFNNFVMPADAQLQWIQNTIKRAFSAARVGVAFNSLSSIMPHRECELYYSDPGQMFSWCVKHVTSNLTLRHDYSDAGKPDIPIDYTIILRK